MDVQALDLQRRASECVTARAPVFLPTNSGGLTVGKNRSRLKNRLRRVERCLVQDGICGEAKALVDGVRRVIDDEWRWRQLSDGLALFASPGRVRYFPVPLQLPELATAGSRFLVEPLLPILAADGRFFMLALDSDDIRLFTGARFRFYGVTLNSALLAELTMARPRKRPVHAFVADRGGAGSRPVLHGSGGGAEDRQESVLQHFHRVDRVVRDVLAGERAPLVLAAVSGQPHPPGTPLLRLVSSPPLGSCSISPPSPPSTWRSPLRRPAGSRARRHALRHPNLASLDHPTTEVQKFFLKRNATSRTKCP